VPFRKPKTESKSEMNPNVFSHVCFSTTGRLFEPIDPVLCPMDPQDICQEESSLS
jgi:hypothetical protein